MSHIIPRNDMELAVIGQIRAISREVTEALMGVADYRAVEQIFAEEFIYAAQRELGPPFLTLTAGSGSDTPQGRIRSKGVQRHFMRMADDPPDAGRGDERRIVGRAIRKTMKEIAEAFFGTVGHDVITCILKQEFVATACRGFEEDYGKEPTVSDVIWLTGVDAKEIREILDVPQSQWDQLVPLFTSDESLVRCWTNDSRFLDVKTGRPSRLKIYGTGHSFQNLVQRVISDGSLEVVEVAVESLVSKGAVRVIDTDWVELLVDPDWQPALTVQQLRRIGLAPNG